MPAEKQRLIGQRLNQYLASRMVMSPAEAPVDFVPGNRWYDHVTSLFVGLESLKEAPHPIKQQSTDYLLRLLEENNSNQACA